MFDHVEVNFKSLKLIKKFKNTTTTKTKNLTLNTFFKQCWVCECSTASNAVLLCFSPGWTFWSPRWLLNSVAPQNLAAHGR